MKSPAPPGLFLAPLMILGTGIKGRPMLAVMGENDKRLPNFRVLEEETADAGVDFHFLLTEGVGHKLPEEHHAEILGWMKEKVIRRTAPATDEVPEKPAKRG